MMFHRALHLLVAATVLGVSHAFVVAPAARRTVLSSLFMSSEVSDDDDEVVEPGKMRVTEIKGELEMRGIRFDDCFDKEAMVERLEEARATGRADPSILKDFNKKKLEENFSGKKMEVTDEDLERIKANDGSLPGGMNPEMLKKLMGNPEIMALLQSPKMQVAMSVMMTGGREELDEAILRDPELQQVIQKLNTVMGGPM